MVGIDDLSAASCGNGEGEIAVCHNLIIPVKVGYYRNPFADVGVRSICLCRLICDYILDGGNGFSVLLKVNGKIVCSKGKLCFVIIIRRNKVFAGK